MLYSLSPEGLLLVAIKVSMVTPPIFTKDTNLQPLSKWTTTVLLLLESLHSVLENGFEAAYRGENLAFKQILLNFGNSVILKVFELTFSDIHSTIAY